MTAKATPIDPLEGPKIALSGRVVRMNDKIDPIQTGAVYIDKGLIVAVQQKDQQPPVGFETTPLVDTGGTLFPGLIELHNHLSYNALPLWKIPRKFENRDQWGRIKEYGQLVSGPMRIVGKTPRLLPSLVRFVECKALIAGVTTTQGIELASNSSVRSYYRGIVRNVENTDDQDLPEALTRIDDVDARDIDKFYARLMRSNRLLLHLSEGIDDRAKAHFQALNMGAGKWAIGKQLVGIHCAGLTEADFAIMQAHDGSMVWSPMSNLLLYGQTALVASAKHHGVKMGIGSDWSPTGSKNLLCELKVAKLYSQENGGFLSDIDIVRAVTSDAAAVIGWQNAVGVLEKGKRADIVVIDGSDDDAYSSLIKATEKEVHLVMINGVARYGEASLMERLNAKGEKITIGGAKRRLYLKQETQDPRVAAVSLKTATSTLRKAFLRLPALAKELEKSGTQRVRMMARGIPEPLEWTLALDEMEETGLNLRPRLPLQGMRGFTGPSVVTSRTAGLLVKAIDKVHIDKLTIVDDPNYIGLIKQQTNLPDYIKEGLDAFYR